MKKNATRIKGEADTAKLLNFLGRLSYAYSRQAAQYLYGRTTDSAMRMITRKLRVLEGEGLVKSQIFKNGKALRNPDGQLSKSVNPAGCEKVYALTDAGARSARERTSGVRSPARDVFSTVHDHRTQSNNVLIASTSVAQSWAQDGLRPSFAILAEWECSSTKGGFDELQRRATYTFESDSKSIVKKADLIWAGKKRDGSTTFVWVEVENSPRSAKGMKELVDFLTCYEMYADGALCSEFLFVITSPDARSMPARLLQHLNGEIYQIAGVLDPRSRRVKDAAMRAYGRCVFRVLNLDSFTLEPMPSSQAGGMPEPGKHGGVTKTSEQPDQTGLEVDGGPDDLDAEPEPDGETGDTSDELEPDEVEDSYPESDEALGEKHSTDEDGEHVEVKHGSNPSSASSPAQPYQESVGGLNWEGSYDSNLDDNVWTAWYEKYRVVVADSKVVKFTVYHGHSDDKRFEDEAESLDQARSIARDVLKALVQEDAAPKRGFLSKLGF